ncbi:unnamed protein product [Blepharisma stoltei]|uniref:Histidine kinase n=1 Tax=Blepharisma stoltei TaxID=1481888 RepID=A0AAU9JA51_9CILI|nr:unnamed protein product [Blepharisma stoltei]
MHEIQRNWWEEQFSYMHKLLVCFTLAVPLFLGVAVSLYRIFSSYLNILGCIISVLTACSPSFWIIKHFSRKSTIAKSTIAVLCIEIYSTAAFIISRNIIKDESGVFHLLSYILTIQLQLPLIRSKIFANILFLKHVLLWYFFDTIFGSLKFPINIELFAAIFAIIIVFNIWNSYRSKFINEYFMLKKELECSKDQFKLITQAFSDGILILSENHKVEFCSSSMHRFLESNNGSLFWEISKYEYCEGKKFSGFPTSNILIDDIDYAFEVLDDEEISLGVTLIGDIYIEWKGKIVAWETKRALFLVARDINLILELEKSAANDRMKTVLLRSVSHELRTPLNSIDFFVNDILEKRPKSDYESEVEKLKIISVSSKLMLSLINDLLDYSKIIAGVFSVHKCYCNIRNIIENTCSLIKIQASKKKISLLTRIDPFLPELIYTDQLRLSQIILNLLSNALKFTKEGWIEICCWLSLKNKLKISIKDTGIGISKEIKRKLFSEFNSPFISSINPQGCGLGLCISNFLAIKLGKKAIKVKSKLRKGSFFMFSIDISPLNTFPEVGTSSKINSENENSAHIDIQRYSFQSSYRNYDILIVDDNELNRMVLGSIISQQHWTYEEACNGKDAVNKFLSHNSKANLCKIVIMDCEMPEMSGIEAASQIIKYHKEGIIEKLPKIIGYSAYSSEEDRKECIRSGMVDYMIKPSPAEEIIRIIKKHLN